MNEEQKLKMQIGKLQKQLDGMDKPPLEVPEPPKKAIAPTTDIQPEDLLHQYKQIMRRTCDIENQLKMRRVVEIDENRNTRLRTYNDLLTERDSYILTLERMKSELIAFGYTEQQLMTMREEVIEDNKQKWKLYFVK